MRKIGHSPAACFHDFEQFFPVFSQQVCEVNRGCGQLARELGAVHFENSAGAFDAIEQFESGHSSTST
jgi:hypothetical protein